MQMRKFNIWEVLQIIFIILKLTNAIDWSWSVVLLPALIVAGAYVILLGMTAIKKHKEKVKQEQEAFVEEIIKKTLESTKF